MASARFSPNTLAALAAIRELEVPKLQDLIQRLRALSPAPLKTSTLRDQLKEAFGEKAGQVAPQLLGLYGGKRINRWKPRKLVQNLTRDLALLEEDRWTDDELEKWRGLEPLLEDLFGIEVLDTASKAIDLAYEYANLFQSARIVTDIRPVFDESASEIAAAVISQTLRIYFSSEEGDHSLSIALDQLDLERLRESCDRAIKKARVAQKLIGESKVPASIAGEPDED